MFAVYELDVFVFRNTGLGGKVGVHVSYFVYVDTVVRGVFMVAARSVIAVLAAIKWRSVDCVSVGT